MLGIVDMGFSVIGDDIFVVNYTIHDECMARGMETNNNEWIWFITLDDLPHEN